MSLPHRKNCSAQTVKDITHSHHGPPDPPNTETTQDIPTDNLALVASKRRDHIDARRTSVRIIIRAVRAQADGADGVLAAALGAVTHSVPAR